MALENLLSDLEKIESDGAVIVIKWDGERTVNKRTVVVTKHEGGYSFRRDSDDVPRALQEAINDYRQKFSGS